MQGGMQSAARTWGSLDRDVPFQLGFRWVYRLFGAGAMFSVFFEHKNKIPVCVSRQGFWNLILTMTYSHMGKPHTTIGDASFHF